MYSDLKISEMFDRIKLLISSHKNAPFLYTTQNDYDRVNCHGLKFYIPKDIFVYNEIYIQKQYGQKFNGTILDIGANTGIFSFYALQHGASKIYAFEPYEPVFNILENRIRDNNETRIIPSNTLVYNRTGTVPYIGLHTIGMVDDSSHHLIKSTWINDIVTPEITTIKIDVEGSEYPILKSLYDSNKLTEVETYFVEIHNFGMTENHINDIFDMFRKSNFYVSFDMTICEEPYVHMIHFRKIQI